MKSNTSSVSAMHGRQMSSHQAYPCQAGPSARQIISDVTMLASWAVLIPGMMWIGSAVGF